MKIKLPDIDMQEDYVELRKKIELIHELTSPGKPTTELPASYRKFNDGYMPPSPEEIKKAFEGYSDSEISEMLGIDTRNMRRWQNDVDKETNRGIPYSAWRLFLILTSKVTPL